MLHNISQVAEEFGVSKRTIQMWCKAKGIKKIGNEYQITDEVLNNWKAIKAKSEAKDYTKQISVRSSAKASFSRSFILQIVLIIWILFSIVVLAYFYNDLMNEIEKRDTYIFEYKKEVQNVRNELRETTIKKDNEIQSLKKKIVIDSMLMNQPRFYKRNFKP
jgi:DNA-binding transcriptional MerR regulator